MVCGCNFFSIKNNNKKNYCIVCKKYIKMPEHYVKFLLENEENVFKCKKCQDNYLQEQLINVSVNDILFVQS